MASRSLPVLLVVLLSAGLTGTTYATRQTAPATSARPATAPELVGTWTLASIEQGIDGSQPSRAGTPRGLLILDKAGHAFETVSYGARQQQGRGDPTPASPAQTFGSFLGFWGSYRLDPTKKTVTYLPEGAVSPNAMGRELTRSFELTSDRLTFTSMPGEPHTKGVTRWTWERVPVVENLSPGYRQVIGFWQHVVEKRVNLTTGVAPESRRAPSIIVYSPSGFVGVHFPPLNRQRFAAAEPTDAEARAALMGYVGYYGALTVYPNMVFHNIIAGLSTSGTLKRPFELSGSEITIKFPVTRNQQGQETSTWVTLRRLSGASDMLPASP